MQFSYKVKTKADQIIEGVVEAVDETTAVNILHSREYIVLSLNKLDERLMAADVTKFLARIKNKDIVVFTRQLAVLIDADMPISEGLRTLARQSDNPNLRTVLGDVSQSVDGGSSLSEALAIYPKIFSNFYIKLIRSGELSGKLHEAMLYLADYLERSQAISAKLKSALAYPAFILFSLVIVGFIMTIYVLPQLLSIFEEAGVSDLPFTTRILIFVTNFVNNNLILLSILIVAASGLMGYYLMTSDGKRWLDNAKVRFPALGKVVQNLYLARMAESLSTLIKSGIPILEAMKITGDIVGNQIYKAIMDEAEQNVKAGGRMSDVFSKYVEMPPLFSSMVAIGEKTGKLDFILEHISKFYKNESENSIQTISTIIEPALVLLLGIAVAIMVSSILLPIYNLVGAG